MFGTILFSLLLVFPLAGALSLKDIPASIGHDGREISKQFFGFLRGAAKKIQYDGRASEFHKYIETSLEKFELKKLYQSEFLQRSEDGTHRIAYRGTFSREGYTVKLEEKRSNSFPPAFGDFSADFLLKHNPKPFYGGNSYSGNLDLTTNLGPFTNKHALAALEILLKYLDSENVKKIDAPATAIFRKVNPPESRKVLNDFSKSFPDLGKFLNYYFGLDSLLTFSETGKVGGEVAVTKFHFKGFLSKNLSDDYAELGDYIDSIKYLGWINVTIENPKGRTLAEFRLDSKRPDVSFKFITKQGKIFPYDSKGTLFPEESFAISSLNRFPFQIRIALEANLYGLLLENSEILLSGVFVNFSDNGFLSLKILKVNPFDVSGGFSYVIPTWAIDFVIPGNLESIIREFTDTLVRANGDKGTKVVLSWNRELGKTFLRTHLESEFLDNFLIRFGLKIWNHKVLPSEEAREDIRNVFIRAVDLILKEI
ncbi:hypothetical protein EHQ12_17415 [Leptospira gomenensis]|uniref:Uncharacterized protein n=1 Tax=Leptospira gomenensis TaxID=2484974 RepID=A0A5F1Y7F0_9LEPT|nr:hypothetical protein EHQ17_15920 [Leptospira gomenensis]TGK33683.1 hypothetical protein EHQ12_17415 [Leptospira gomenensis]TGK44925.1 hypothetical protein EHQ07_11370 [Leptospira gomenensis]TGK64551.1 hypothetical protein EHQ13_07455 [Leptospira gomenensis]